MTTVRPTNTTDTLVLQYLDIEAQIEALEDQRDKITEILLARIPLGEAVEAKGARVAHAVNSSRYVDVDALEGINKTWFRRLTKRVLNVSALNTAFENGNLPGEVRAIVQTKTSKPFLRFTKR